MKTLKLTLFLIASCSSFCFNQTNYYWNGVGDGDITTSWGQNIDGSGAQPSNFTNNNQIFNIQNGQILNTFSAAWIVSGANSKVTIQSGGKISTTLNHKIPLEMLAYATYEVTGKYGEMYQIGTWNPTSTFILKSDNLRPSFVYGNLEINAPNVLVDNTGSLTIGGNLIISAGTLRFGTSSSNNIIGDVQISNGATWNIANNDNAHSYNISGTITNNGTISAVGNGIPTLNFNGSSNITIQWGSVTTNRLNVNIASTNNATLNDNLTLDIGTFTVNGVVNFGTSSVLSGSGAFTLSSGATLITANANGIGTNGSIAVTGIKTFNSSANYEFQGMSTGTFPSSPQTVNNITFNNSSGVSMACDITATGIVNLASGNLNLNGYSLTFSGNILGTPSWGSSAGNYIIATSGFLIRDTPGNTIFPVGTASQYYPCMLSGGGFYFVSIITPPSPGLTQQSLALPIQWNITGSGTTAMEFQWPSDIFGTTAYLYQYSGTSWSTAAGPTSTNGSGPITAGFSGITVTCCTGFTVGGFGVLPVELIDFQAKVLKYATILTWQTASELDNDYFAIEKSTNGTHFSEIGSVPGNGTSFEVNNYTFTDENPAPGYNYYRLKQVDFDGQFTYSKVVSVAFKDRTTDAKLYPTLTQGLITLQLGDADTDFDQILFFNQTGRLVHPTRQQEQESDGLVFDVSQLQRGHYFVRIQQGRQFETLRFTKI